MRTLSFKAGKLRIQTKKRALKLIKYFENDKTHAVNLSLQIRKEIFVFKIFIRARPINVVSGRRSGYA